jgi:hypothetical protein
VICATHATAFEVLADLLHRGYQLSVSTRVEETVHKFGTQRTTYGDRLRVEGAKPPPEELRVAIAENLDELLAAACIIRPPVPWIAKLVGRCQHGHTMEAKRLLPYRKRDGTVGLKTGPVTTTTTPQTVAANLASFIRLHPARDRERLEPIIREVLRADEAAIAMLHRKEIHNDGVA